MKTSLTFLYDNKTGNIQYIDKTRFIKEFCGSLSQKNNKIIDLQEIKKLNSSTYRDILKKYDKSFLKLSPGIQSTKLNRNIQLILLLDKTTEDFEKYCKKNNWKFGQEVEKLNNISDDIKPNLSLLKNKKKSQESPQKQGIIYSKEKVSLNDSLQKIWQYKPKETKEELKMKNKNIVKKVAVASLAALISIPNIVGSTNTYAAYNQMDQESGVSSGKVLSAVNQGQYTLINDDWGTSYLVNSSQWQEYQLLLQQGSPEVILVITTNFDNQFHTIDSYQLKGQTEVNLPKSSCIKVNDPYNCDQLTVLKHIGNQLGTSYLYNQQKFQDDIDKKNAQIYSDIAKQEAKQQAQVIADQQQIDLNNQINAELNTKSENKVGQKTSLPYSSNYIAKYVLSQEEISHNKVWASFDNERNYIQQWLTAHGFNSMQELKNYAYKTGVTHYGLQEQVAIQYCQYVEEGKCSSIGDYIRLKFKEGQMKEWNQLSKWTNYCDFTVINAANTTGNKLILYVDEYNINKEVYKMLEANLSVIASYTSLTKEQKTAMVEQFKNGKNYWSDGISNADLGRKYVNGYESAGELGQRLLDKWNTEYLPNIKE